MNQKASCRVLFSLVFAAFVILVVVMCPQSMAIQPKTQTYWSDSDPQLCQVSLKTILDNILLRGQHSHGVRYTDDEIMALTQPVSSWVSSKDTNGLQQYHLFPTAEVRRSYRVFCSPVCEDLVWDCDIAQM